ncbi:MAG TPA: phosphoribosylanthranilate isomerase [Xanthomonadaceae bacterium]|nr:phosphoribosylanthranilate isomerase [Xanthomonadaceae bacterium]
MRARIKFCGITRVEDALAAADMGVDAVGLVFVPGSARHVDLEAGQAVRRALPPFVTLVALFLDAEPTLIGQVIERVGPDALQFHGSEPEVDCRRWARPYLKALPMASVLDWRAHVGQYPSAQGFVLDSHATGAMGGSGEAFDWSALAPPHPRPLILAGGLRPDNVGEAVRRVRPWAVDVSSGIESAPGVKCPALMQSFVEEVRGAVSR